MRQGINFILFGNDTLHVSDGFSVHHQAFKTTYSNRHLSNRYCCLLASKQTELGSAIGKILWCTALWKPKE